MKKIYYLYMVLMAISIGFASCNNEWEDEQYVQMASFKAEPNTQGVTFAYVRYKSEGKVVYQLPVVISGSTPSTETRTVHVGLDSDTLKLLNVDQYGHRENLYFRQLTPEYYNMPETIEVPAGQRTATIPIEFSLEDLDQSDKWVLPLQILDDPQYNYVANPNKYYRRAMLRINPFNDYSGKYSAALTKIFIAPDKTHPLSMPEIRTYVVNENTIFMYAGLRGIDYEDRKLYKIFIEFTDEIIDIQKKKLRIYTDNPLIKLKVNGEPYYTIEEEMDATKKYMKHIYITLGIDYEFEDYNTIPGYPMKYTVTGSMAMQRDLNTLIPDEDQQIQW